jgi:hypothetical protein
MAPKQPNLISSELNLRYEMTYAFMYRNGVVFEKVTNKKIRKFQKLKEKKFYEFDCIRNCKKKNAKNTFSFIS